MKLRVLCEDRVGASRYRKYFDGFLKKKMMELNNTSKKLVRNGISKKYHAWIWKNGGEKVGAVFFCHNDIVRLIRDMQNFNLHRGEDEMEAITIDIRNHNEIQKFIGDSFNESEEHWKEIVKGELEQRENSP
jgi:hypothetical protein